MPNHKLHSLLKDEYVKRFDSMMKQEMTLHNEVITAHQKEMQILRDSVKEAKDKYESLFHHIEKGIKENTEFFKVVIENLEQRIKILEFNFSEQRSSIFSVYKSLTDFMQLCSTKKDFENFKKDTLSHIKEHSENKNRSFENYQQEVNRLFQGMKEGIKQIRLDTDNQFSQFQDMVNDKCDLAKMDKDGVLKVVRVYEKSMYIIEKKIENIYTLIERINKRGDLCHKLD